MRTSALPQCAPGPAHIRCCGHVLRSRGLCGPCRARGTGRDGSDPPVRGPGTGSGPGVLAHPCPRPLWVASVPAIRPGRVSSAASRRRRMCWPTGWPSGFPPSPTKAGTRLFRLAFRLPAWDCWPGATPGRQGRGCEYTLAAMPHQALGAAGRSRHGHSGPFGNGRPGRLAARRCKRGGIRITAV